MRREREGFERMVFMGLRVGRRRLVGERGARWRVEGEPTGGPEAEEFPRFRQGSSLEAHI